jgi:hypothetical protein
MQANLTAQYKGKSEATRRIEPSTSRFQVSHTNLWATRTTRAVDSLQHLTVTIYSQFFKLVFWGVALAIWKNG